MKAVVVLLSIIGFSMTGKILVNGACSVAYTYTSTMDEMAQSSCTGLTDKEGWSYAVRRQCTGKETCDSICESLRLKAQDSQLSTYKTSGSCEDALHVYKCTGMTTFKQLGYKVYRYRTCRDTHCGPNYCCCRFTTPKK